MLAASEKGWERTSDGRYDNLNSSSGSNIIAADSQRERENHIQGQAAMREE
jgi:hypothetical protein